MPVAVEMQFASATLEQYDEVIRRMGFQPGGAGAEGGLFHWATLTPEGLRVVDVWESAEQFEAFADNTIGPITQEVGLDGPPQVTIRPIHNYLTAG